MPDELKDSEPVSGEAVEEEKKAPPTMKNQVFGILVLIAVFGLLWLITKGMGPLGEFLGSGLSKTIGSVKVEGPVELKAEGESQTAGAGAIEPRPVPQAKVRLIKAPLAEQNSEPDSVRSNSVDETLPIPEDFVRQQIVETLGGDAKVEVRHLAFSDDVKRLIASVKLMSAGKEARLTEIIFERDEFGRYNSTENSPVDIPIKIWPR